MSDTSAPTEPNGAAPVSAAPVSAAPVSAARIEAEPIETEPIETEPIGAEPIETASTAREAAEGVLPAVDEAERGSAPTRVNALAVAALILGVLLSPLAALFGHLAVGQITRSARRERGLIVAWVAVGLGYLWLVAIVLVAIGVVVVLGA